MSLWDNDRIFAERIAISDYPDSYEREVPKGYHTLSAYCGIRRAMVERSRFTIPLGEDCDSVFVYSHSLPCLEEFTRDTVKLLKKFTRVTLKINMPDQEDCPFLYTVRSQVCGMDLHDYSPVYGEFRKVLSVEGNEARFCLPRQDPNMTHLLDVLVETQGKTLHTIELGRIMDDMGYSWSRRDLEDITVDVDYVKAEITIRQEGWDAGGSYDIVL